MAISITTPQARKFGFIINATSADISGAEILKAAPAAGLSIIVDFICINNGAGAQGITIGEGINGAAVLTPLIGPCTMAANTSLQFDFSREGFAVKGMALTPGLALTCDSTSNTGVCIFIIGRVE
jgi:hypothetical protein